LYRDGRPVDADRLPLSNGLFLGLDLRGDAAGKVGYRARDDRPLLDMTRTRHADPGEFWEDVKRDAADRVVLIPQRFYLLMSGETVAIPPDRAAEMTAYDPTSGELRTHYAGFFDPGFGFRADGSVAGSRVALEVRAHDVAFMVEHGQPVCKLTFERMLEAPTSLYGGAGSSYQWQEEALGKHFRVAAGTEDPTDRAAAAERNQDQLSFFPPDP
jgi:dCTP deaminase